jgi:hypothetical protein
VRAVHPAAAQVQLAEGAELSQQLLVQRRPDGGGGPVPQPSPAGHSGAANYGRGQLVPGDAGLEHEHDPGQRGPVVDQPTARMPVAPRLGRWQQWSDPLPQPIRDELLDHPPESRHDRPSLEAGAELILKRSLKRLRTRYERRGDIHLGLLQLACSLICYRHLPSF